MDRPLDDSIAERQNRGRGPPPRRSRPTYPRDGVRKQQSTREDRANLDNDWVHDRYDDEVSPNRGGYPRSRPKREEHRDERRSPEPERREPLPAKLRIDNLHYDLNEDQIYELFVKIGPVRDAKLTYDRAGRSEGVAFVTYDRVADAREAIREFDGANAKGQPIRLTLLPPPPRATQRKDNPFDRVVNPKSLFDRIEAPTGRDTGRQAGRARRRSDSPMSEVEEFSRNGSRRPQRGERRSNVTRPAPDNIDRYVPGQGGQGGRDSSRRGGRRPGERRERKPENNGTRGGARPKKTAEQLDAEMDDYWGTQNAAGGETATAANPGASTTAAQATDDIDMIE